MFRGRLPNLVFRDVRPPAPIVIRRKPCDAANPSVTLYREAHRVAVALPILRGWRLWLRAVRNDSASCRPTLVEPGVWVGGIPSPRRWRELREAGVTAAICLLREGPPPRWTSAVEQLLWLPVVDEHAPTQEQVATGCAFLDLTRAQGRGMFIFCRGGMGRAPTLYLAWRVRRAGETLDAAIARIRLARPGLCLTARQVAALRSWSGAHPVGSQADGTRVEAGSREP